LRCLVKVLVGFQQKVQQRYIKHTMAK